MSLPSSAQADQAPLRGASGAGRMRISVHPDEPFPVSSPFTPQRALLHRHRVLCAPDALDKIHPRHKQAAGLLIMCGDEALMVQSKWKDQEFWNVPTDGREAGVATLLATAKREWQEEVGPVLSEQQLDDMLLDLNNDVYVIENISSMKDFGAALFVVKLADRKQWEALDHTLHRFAERQDQKETCAVAKINISQLLELGAKAAPDGNICALRDSVVLVLGEKKFPIRDVFVRTWLTYHLRPELRLAPASRGL